MKNNKSTKARITKRQSSGLSSSLLRKLETEPGHDEGDSDASSNDDDSNQMKEARIASRKAIDLLMQGIKKR